MQSEILDTLILSNYPTKRDDLLINNVLPLDNGNLLIMLTKGYGGPDSPQKLIIEIKGNLQRTIDVSYLYRPNTGVHSKSIFRYKQGFGLIDHDHAHLYLWDTLEGSPQILTVHNSASKSIRINEKYLKFASYDDSNDSFVIGIGSSGSPVTYAKWWAELSLSNGKEPSAFWDQPVQLNPENYPPTKFHYKDPALEWLNITDIICHQGRKFMITPGGQYTVGKTGVQFEFHILSVYDDQNRLVKNIELEFGGGRFTSDKKYFILKPKKKKRLLVYNLKTLKLDFNIPLKSDSNMGPIPTNHGVLADLKDDLLYVYNLTTLNVCQLSG